MKATRLFLATLVVLGLLALMLWNPFAGPEEETPTDVPEGFAQGLVFHDRNENGLRDDGEPGLPGIRVSDQRSVTETDRHGRWTLPRHQEAIYFVVKPRGYRTTFSQENLPEFFYVHKETEGLPLEGPVLHPTGPLPESVDFPLIAQEEPESFDAIFMGDPQPRNEEEVDFFTHDILGELVGTSAAFAVVLGDIGYDNRDTYLPYNRATAAVGIPFYNTPGNHDANYDGLDPDQHYETWRTLYGPPYYSFDYGPVHFVILNDVVFPEEGSRYVAGLGEKQLDWLAQDLSFVPEDQLVVLAMHIPPPLSTEESPDFARLYEIVGRHPYSLSFSAHLHTVSQGFLTSEHGWEGTTPHHHINAGASCGRWWGGERDETDIPHATSSDGTPNGYFVVSFDGHEYSARYKAARRPADYQMEIQAPSQVSRARLSETPILVNVFAGNERSVVEMAIGPEGEWIPMRFSPQVDPLYARVTERESGQGASVANHIWEVPLPASLPPGGHLIRVRFTDMYGQVFTDARILRVVEGGH